MGDLLGFGNGNGRTRGFFKLGMDSLMAVELSRRLGSDWAVTCRRRLPSAFNIEGMADFLGREVLGWPDDDGGRARRDTAPAL